MADEGNCIFCRIIKGDLPSTTVWESKDFLAIKSKFPSAPIHILVIPKEHWEKELAEVPNNNTNFGNLMNAVFETIKVMNLQKSGYKIVVNGGGYEEISHEHVHVLSGLEGEKG